MSLREDIEDLKKRIFDLAAAVRGAPYFRWGTVDSVAPLRVLVDGDAAVLPGVPASLVSGLRVGERVRVEFQNRRATITGRGKGGATEWTVLPLAAGVTVHNGVTPQYRFIDGALELRGAVAASFTTSYRVVINGGVLPPQDGFHSTRLLPSGSGAPAGRSFIESDGKMQVATTGGTASYYLLNSIYYPE